MFLPSSTRAPFGGERTIFFTFHMKLLSLLTVYTLFLSERGLFCCVSCSVTRQGVGGASMRNAAERLARREREGTGGREYIDPQVHVFSCNNSEAVVKWITLCSCYLAESSKGRWMYILLGRISREQLVSRCFAVLFSSGVLIDQTTQTSFFFFFGNLAMKGS